MINTYRHSRIHGSAWAKQEWSLLPPSRHYVSSNRICHACHDKKDSCQNMKDIFLMINYKITPDLGMQQSVDATCDPDFQTFFKPFLQSREQDNLTVTFVIHCSINSYDNPAKNSCSERDPPRPRSEHKFYGIFLLIN